MVIAKKITLLLGTSQQLCGYIVTCSQQVFRRKQEDGCHHD
jgi:hypothetical protein